MKSSREALQSQVRDRPLVATLAGKFVEKPFDGAAPVNTHREPERQPIHGGEKVASMSTGVCAAAGGLRKVVGTISRKRKASEVLPERAMEVPCEPPDGRGEGTITRNCAQCGPSDRPRRLLRLPCGIRAKV